MFAKPSNTTVLITRIPIILRLISRYRLLQQHIEDLRFLLSHQISQQTRQARTAFKPDKSNPKTTYSDALVKSFQEEIVRLEGDLQRNKSKPTQTTEDSSTLRQVRLVVSNLLLLKCNVSSPVDKHISLG